jgi:hypothetical protein
MQGPGREGGKIKIFSYFYVSDGWQKSVHGFEDSVPAANSAVVI